MGFLKRLFCGCPEDYDICEERGHDFREGVEMEHQSKVNQHRLAYLTDSYEVSDRVEVSRTGRPTYTLLTVRRVAVNVCRDCGEENQATDDKKNLVLCEDGDYRPFDDLFTPLEEEE